MAQDASSILRQLAIIYYLLTINFSRFVTGKWSIMEITLVVDVLCFADRTLDGSWFFDVDIWLDAHH